MASDQKALILQKKAKVSNGKGHLVRRRLFRAWFFAKFLFICFGCSGKDWLAVDHGDQMEAAWLFVQYLFGIHRDDHDYDKVIVRLSAELKAYIKLLVCFPNRIFDKEFEHIPKAVSASDLVSMLFICDIFVVIMQ